MMIRYGRSVVMKCRSLSQHVFTLFVHFQLLRFIKSVNTCWESDLHFVTTDRPYRIIAAFEPPRVLNAIYHTFGAASDQGFGWILHNVPELQDVADTPS